jgi:aspartate/methionine/tyrosine aminotransferase
MRMLHAQSYWTIDLEDLEARLTPRTRAVVVVAPNNPTGSVPTTAEWMALLDLCARFRLTLIVDEVFAPYRFDERPDGAGVSMPADLPALTVRLNGLSKLVGLPQAKLAWMILDGPVPLVREAVDRLEVIADTYLSVSTPVQVALPTLLADGGVVRDQIRSRIARNLDTLARSAACGDVASLRRPQGGWTAVLRAPGLGADADALVRALLDRGVLAHPAYFYDFAHDGYLVVSLLTPPDQFDEGLDALSNVLATGCTS